MSVMRNMLLIMPFLLVAWFEWVRSIQQQQRDKPRTSLMQRDAERARAALGRRIARRQRQMQEVATAGADAQGSAQSAATPQLAVHPVEATSAVQKPATTTTTCPASRKPYHTVLTATAQVYQQWQCRVMYYRWKKIRDADPAGACTEMTGFTRLVARGDAAPDGLEGEIPSYFVKEYTQRDYARFHGYRVINRPYSVVQFLASDYYRERVREEYLFIAETDHILTQPLPNKARLGSPMAYIFNYMGPNPAHQGIIQKAWPEGGASGYRNVQSIGPSPVVIHRQDLGRLAKHWEETAVHLKTDPEADQRLGWVIEMWGYAIAAAKIGLVHHCLLYTSPSPRDS